MRPTIPRQTDLFRPPRASHRLAQELAQISVILTAHPEWQELVRLDLVAGVDGSRGRRGMSADRVLRTLILKPRLKASYESLAERLSDDLTAREFVGLTLTEKAPRRSTLQDNLRKVRPETLGAILKSRGWRWQPRHESTSAERRSASTAHRSRPMSTSRRTRR